MEKNQDGIRGRRRLSCLLRGNIVKYNLFMQSIYAHLKTWTNPSTIKNITYFHWFSTPAPRPS